MKLTDSHTHLADPLLHTQLNNILAQAEQAGVRRFIAPSATAQDWPVLAVLQSDRIICAFGIHPWFAAEADDACLKVLDNILSQHPHALAGEIGLDYYRSPSPAARRQQQQLFQKQLEIAQYHGRPVILHNLRAGSDLVRLIKDNGFNCGGFAHAFSGSLEEAREFIRLGFKIGIGSLLLNPAAKKARQAAALLPLDSIVLETDSPFMSKDSTNTPANTRRIAETAAKLRGIPLAELAEQTEKNVGQILSVLVR